MAERHSKGSRACESGGDRPAGTLDSSIVLLDLVRLLAQQTAREVLDQETEPEE